VRQFGSKAAAVEDGRVRQALADGRPFFDLETLDGRPGYRGIVPIRADRSLAGKQCGTCHEGNASTVLGAVSFRLDLDVLARSRREFRRTMLLAAGGLALGLGLCGYGLITRTVSRPLVAVADELRDISQGEGDLTRRLHVGRRDEIGSVAHWFNTFVEALHAIVTRLRGAAAHVGGAAQTLRDAAEELSRSVQQQASALEQTAASLEEIGSSVKQNADSARQADELARASQARAEAGQAVVADAVSSMTEITATSGRIAGIIATVDGIAFQTNLLALNAAVEAARAGEQGRGFAVVAAEVRTLAHRTAAAAREIKGLIDDSTRRVDAGAALVTRSGQTLAEIVASVAQVSALVASIAGASREQAAGLQQVNQAVTSMDRGVQATATRTDALAATARELASSAGQLTALVGRFRVAGGDGARAGAAPPPARGAASPRTAEGPLVDEPAPELARH
jgi:methyl-accepting chemotaxis protein